MIAFTKNPENPYKTSEEDYDAAFPYLEAHVHVDFKQFNMQTGNLERVTKAIKM